MSDGQQLVDWYIKKVENGTVGTHQTVVIIVDFEMPRLTGIEAIKEIRSFFNIWNERQKKKSLNSSLPELTDKTSL